MKEATTSTLIYDWNLKDSSSHESKQPVTFFCETLRDGIQSPSAFDPPLTKKKQLLELADALGIQHIDIGLPGAGQRAVNDCIALAQHASKSGLAIELACAARTHLHDVQAIIDISQATGTAIEVMAFIGSSPIRSYTENWDIDLIEQRTTEAIELARRHQLRVTYVTEDTTRSHPDTLCALFHRAIEAGASRLCLCDTVGHATPDGVKHLVQWTRNTVDKMGRSDVGIDWHGHNDRGLGVVNSLAAIEAGADRCHGTALGIGERVGNAALDQILLNLYLMNKLPPQHNLSQLTKWCRTAAEATHIQIHPQYPLVGEDAFRTATGVHAAAIIKAQNKGDKDLADRVYSSVPAGVFGMEQQIEIGHYSGESNVIYWLQKHGYEPDKTLIQTLLETAKRGNHVLSNQEIEEVIAKHAKKTS